MADPYALEREAAAQVIPGQRDLLIGHTDYRQQGRVWVRVTVFCEHGRRAFSTNHDEPDRPELEARAQIIDTAVRLHREMMREEYGIDCGHPVPSDLKVRRG